MLDNNATYSYLTSFALVTCKEKLRSLSEKFLLEIQGRIFFYLSLVVYAPEVTKTFPILSRLTTAPQK